MKNVSFIISILLLIILMSSKLALCQDNGGTAISDSLQNGKNELKKTNKNSKDYKKIDVFLGGEFPPFKLYAGTGYFITPKIETFIKFSKLAWPFAFDDYSINIGMKSIGEEKNTLVYTYELGLLFSTYEHNYDGLYLDVGLGYLFRFDFGFHIESNFKANYWLQKGEKARLYPSLDLAIGWSF